MYRFKRLAMIGAIAATLCNTYVWSESGGIDEISSSEEEYVSQGYKKKYQKRKNREPLIINRWKPEILNNVFFESTSPYTANLNTGVGFLYFAGSSGNPSIKVAAGTLIIATNNTGFQHRWKYNKTLLNEANMTWNIGGTTGKLNWLGVGLSVLHQGGISINYYFVATDLNPIRYASSFGGLVELNAIVAKFQFYSLKSMIVRGIAYTPTAALSVGPSWQTWSNLNIYDYSKAIYHKFAQKISANCFFGAEMAIQIRSIIPTTKLSAMAGIKFNIWGQARQMGAGNKQPNRDPNSGVGQGYALFKPVKVRTVYQWAPFIGIKWSY